MYFDGAYSCEGAGAGVLIMAPSGEQLKYVLQMCFDWGLSTNNTAEYEGLLAGLRATAGLGIRQLVVRGDSQLVVYQVHKEYECPQMAAYVEEVRKMERHFKGIKMEHITRTQNLIANELSKIGAKRQPVHPGTFVEYLMEPCVKPRPREALPPVEAVEAPPACPGNTKPAKESIPGKHHIMYVEGSTPPWAEDILRYIQDGVLPGDNLEAKRVARRARMYQVIDGTLYRRGKNGVRLRCISQEEGPTLLEDIHLGVCSSHVASREMAGKAFQQGFYWQKTLADAMQVVQTCEACQFHAKNMRGWLLGWQITRSLYPGDEDLVDDELAAKGTPVNT
jgi:ribonuclease HI